MLKYKNAKVIEIETKFYVSLNFLDENSIKLNCNFELGNKDVDEISKLIQALFDKAEEGRTKKDKRLLKLIKID